MYNIVDKTTVLCTNMFKYKLERIVSKNILTHLVNNGVWRKRGFLYGFDRFFHYIVDDVNYRLHNKYIKTNLKNLDKNIKWLQSLNSLEPYIGDEDKSGEIREVLIKLDIFKNIDKIEDECDVETLLKYLESRYLIIESILDYIPNTSKEFRRKHLINNPLIQYVFRLISTHMDKISSDILVKYYKVLLEMEVDDLNDLLVEMYLGIWKRVELERVNKHDKMETQIELLSRIINIVDTSRISDKIEEVLIGSLCSNEVFYNKIDELTRIIYYCYTKQCKSGISSKSYGVDNDDFFSNYNDNYLDNYVLKLNNYVYMLNNKSIINTMYLLCTLKYVDTEVFNKFTEAVMYRFDTFDYEQMELLVSLISSYKHLYIVSGVDLGECVYSEGGNMLLGMLRKYFEEKLVNLRLTRMLEPLVSLTMLGKSSNKMKLLVLEKLDSSMMSQLDVVDFGKLLMLLKNLRVNKSNEYVSGLIYTYITKSSNLLGSEISDDNSVSSALGVVNRKAVDSNAESVLKLLSSFVPKKKYQKYLSSYINKYMEGNGNIYSRDILFFLKLYLDNKLYKYNDKIISSLLYRLMFTSTERNEAGSKYIGFNDSDLLSANESKVIGYNDTNLAKFDENRIIISHDDDMNKLVTSSGVGELSLVRLSKGKGEDEFNSIGIHDLVVILEGVNKCHLTMEKIKYITDIVYDRIYGMLKRTSRWNLKNVQKVIRFIVETRIVNSQLLDCMMEYVYDNLIVSLPNESEIETDMTRVTSTKINLCLLYLKAIVFLNHESSEVDVYNIYNNIVYHLNQSTATPLVNEDIINDLRELLIYEKYNNRNLYEHVIGNLNEELVDMFRGETVFKSTGGKLHAILSKKLSSDYISFHQIEDLIFDFYSPVLNEAVHICKSKHYYRVEEEDGVYLKHKAHMMLNISQKLNIKLKLIPEHKIVEVGALV